MPTEAGCRHGPALVAACVALAATCAPIAARYDDVAAAHGLSRDEIPGAPFRHAVYRPPGQRSGALLHIYIEGDGTPELRPGLPSADPTPRRPLLPPLMARDPAPVVLLGRPCYHGLATTPPCQPEDWTRRRYSDAVVASMAAAARHLVARGEHDGAVLIGHSGGGVLAVLLAERLPSVRAVVALASVIDLDRWSRHHGLAPLDGSLAPIESAPGHVLRPELFLAGAEDRVSPPSLIVAATARRPNSRVVTRAGFDHACCWAEAWPEVLAWVDSVTTP